MKRILVTGGAGFLGASLCRKLINDGNEVICLDRVVNKECQSILHDIIDPLPNIKVDEIYNLAGTPSPAKYMSNPVHTSKTNTIGVSNVLELAKECGAKVLQASTGEVCEDIDWTDFRACYRQGKRMAETLFFDYRRQYGVDIRVARMLNSYGPGMSFNDGRVIPTFILKALSNENITIFDDGSKIRSFCYVDDMIDALILLMHSNYTTAVNIFGEEEVTIKELASKIIDITSSSSLIIFKPSEIGDLHQKNPKTDTAQDLLGWVPKVNLKDGIESTTAYFRGELYVGKEN